MILNTFQFRATSILKYNNKPISQSGLNVEVPTMLNLKMLKGNLFASQDPNAILLSESAAKAIFENDNPINKIIKVENVPAKVVGIYKDMPGKFNFCQSEFYNIVGF